jgi:hypothetical protein
VAAQQRTWTGQIIGVFIVLVIVIWFIQMRRAPMNLVERRDCESAYRAARTAADSAVVDARQPLDATRTGPHALTCGELRKTGRL